MKLHKSITVDRVCALAEENMFGLTNTGICTNCGEEREGCEPDARNYECYSCGAKSVFGAEELLLYLV